MLYSDIRKTPGDTSWFVHDRFGMYIHFGLYSLPARHEWVKQKESIPDEKYQVYFDHFNPDLIDMREWARAAKNAGMKYAVLTTKHHEGFCLFDTKYTDYQIMNTPFGRDLVREYVEAFRAEGLKVGFYYSLLDWHHPDYPIDIRHPLRGLPNAAELDRGRDMHKYAEYMRNQVTELLTNYGKIDLLWFDFSFGTQEKEAYRREVRPWMQFGGKKGENEWEAKELIATVRRLQPHILINDRTEIEQDIASPEQKQPTEWPRHVITGERLIWEGCQTFADSWGYYRDEYNWKTPEALLRLLVDSVSFGGNLIMNVGPTSRGCFDYRATAALNAYGEWMHFNGRSIYGCTQAEERFTAPYGTRLTESEDGKRLYVHLQSAPGSTITIGGLPEEEVEYAQFLSDGSEVLINSYVPDLSPNTKWVRKVEPTGVTFKLPAILPKGLCPVIEIFLKKKG